MRRIAECSLIARRASALFIEIVLESMRIGSLTGLGLTRASILLMRQLTVQDAHSSRPSARRAPFTTFSAAYR